MKRIAAAVALAGLVTVGAVACVPIGTDPASLTVQQQAQAYEATSWDAQVVRFCGVPTAAGAASLPAIGNSDESAYRDGYCFAVTDEPSARLQAWADLGQRDRLKFAIAKGVVQ